MKVVVAKPAGACYGVERALRLTNEALEDYPEQTINTLGSLIHNSEVIEELEKKGAKAVESVEDVDSKVLVIRAHGIPEWVIDRAKEKGINVVDATCPHVAAVQDYAAKMAQQGRFVVIVGEKGHPEVLGIESYAGENHAVILEASEIDNLPENIPIGVVVQTTQRQHRFEEIQAALEKRYKDVLVVNTICSATLGRQHGATTCAKQVDAMVVIGGKNSGNTRRLTEICAEICPKIFHIERASEIDPSWFDGCKIVGVTAGASTPESQLDQVVARLELI